MTARAAILSLLFATFAHANIITTENARPGTDLWRLSHSPSADVAAYASSASVIAGDRIRFYVSTPDPRIDVEIFRMGWYGGLGGRRVTGAVERKGGTQPMPEPDADGMIRCNWSESYSLVIPKNWVSGFYLARITGKPSGKQNHVIFVVREERKADLLFQSSVTTYQAYNNWGGKSLYAHNSNGAPAKKVSFDRPYALPSGPADFLIGWEYDMVRWLEREGYDVTYGTNIDTHARPAMLRRVKAFLSVGHDEYWSWEMRANVEAARDAGIHLGFFSGNTCYWQIRLEDNLRTIVAHKETALKTDPLALDADTTNDARVTSRWRDAPVSRPEEALIGVMSGESQIDGDIVIDDASHWVFANTKLANGDRLRGLLGYEVDAIIGTQSPPGLVRLAHSPYVKITNTSRTGFSDMTIYTAKSGAIVFAVGTIQWSWGLDGYGNAARSDRVNAAAQQITRNVLDRMIGRRRDGA